MYEGLFGKPQTELMHLSEFLGAYVEDFASWMHSRSYSRYIMQTYIWNVTYFGRYLKRHGTTDIKQLDGLKGRELLESYRLHLKRTGCFRRYAGLRWFFLSLQDSGILHHVISESPMRPELRAYAIYLRDYRGIAECIISSRHIHYADKFLKFLGSQLLDDQIPEFGIIEVDRFLEQYRPTHKATTIRVITGVLRSFVKFLYQKHILKSDLSDVIEGPRNYKLQTVVPVLKWTDIQRVLHTINTNDKHGIRNYALLIFMATHGLRVSEITRLKLTDIDWCKEIIHINAGKRKYSLELPLTADVGKAILQYLKYVRPRSQHREIFLLNQAPWNPISPSDVSFIASQCMRRAGLRLPRYGAHLLRHSFATHLLQRGASLKEIGDLLGHQHPDSTYTYTKSAVENLREVALELPG